MKYSGSLVKKEREQIFALFLNKARLKFSEIEKELGIRSNMVAYHLDRMVKDGLLNKAGGYYKLTHKAERYIPVFSMLIGQQLSPVAVVLAAVQNRNRLLLIKRNKRPYKEYWGLIGGKMMLGETFRQASLRLIRNKSGLDARFRTTSYVMQEHVNQDNIIKHSFILFFTNSASSGIPKDKSFGLTKWFTMSELRKLDIIPSDKWFIDNKLDSKSNVKEVSITEDDGRLGNFRFIEG